MQCSPNAGWITSSTVAGVWGGLLMTPLWVGYKGIEWLSYLGQPLILIMCVASCILAVIRIGSLDAFNDITLSYSGMSCLLLLSRWSAAVRWRVPAAGLSRFGRSLKASTRDSVLDLLLQMYS